jgi:dihydroorotate dehydrogenase
MTNTALYFAGRKFRAIEAAGLELADWRRPAPNSYRNRARCRDVDRARPDRCPFARQRQAPDDLSRLACCHPSTSRATGRSLATSRRDVFGMANSAMAQHKPTDMFPVLVSAVLPLLRRLDPERAHGLALRGLRLGLAGNATGPDDPALAISVLGRRFANPIGLAAGFDKGAVAVEALMRLGFGFVETGTVTPRPQPGNPRPRVFRLEPDRAIVNRLGFNNDGLDAYLRALAAVSPRPAQLSGILLGANVGINKTGADPVRDYPVLIEAVAPHVDYAVINVSSPNTPGLRDLQSEAQLAAILAAVAAVPNKPPVLVKIAPDLSRDAIAAVVETCATHDVQGLVVGNTTVSRPSGLCSPWASEPGGLSGAPLFALSNTVLAQTFLLARGRLTLIGAGGVFTGADALTKIRAGASLVQLYTGFAYSGPASVPRLKAELAAALKGAGFACVQDAVGTLAQQLAGL